MNVLGLMSGSSLDGLDIALCRFDMPEGGVLDYELLETKQIEFPDRLLSQLSKATQLSSRELFALEAELGLYIGQHCKQFSDASEHEVDLIASHGHTVFHFPEENYTVQLGNGGLISQMAQRDVVSDFRSSDIGSGGLGAPCAPIADRYLFPDADLFLNIGGISNISYKKDKEIVAFDISPANQLLNYLASREGKVYDKDGELSSQGKIDKEILSKLIHLNGFKNANPRALDNSWVQENFFPPLEKGYVNDLLRTSVEFIVLEIIKAIDFLAMDEGSQGIVITGGGAFNKFLMMRLEQKLLEISIPIIPLSAEVINFKEAMLMALMGFLRYTKVPNVLGSVTGATKDTIGGCIYVY